jgi:hypothetical protein
MATRQPTEVVIPTLLAEAVKSKRAILFLGAGASKEAKNSAGQTPPDADQLRDILAQRFFGKPIKNRDVMAVAEMAITSSGGAGLVFETVRQAFESFQPSKAHKLISAFKWRMVATTNYDLLVEKAYSASPQRIPGKRNPRLTELGRARRAARTAATRRCRAEMPIGRVSAGGGDIVP